MERFEAPEGSQRALRGCPDRAQRAVRRGPPRFADANEWVAENVTSRIATLPGAERLPARRGRHELLRRHRADHRFQPRQLAVKLVAPWVIGTDGAAKATKVKATAETSAAAKPAAKKPAAKKATACKSTARKAAAKS
ncbi:MAG: hypothetical protein R2710_29275 [Acidimicrobiales bacterium]